MSVKCNSFINDTVVHDDNVQSSQNLRGLYIFLDKKDVYFTGSNDDGLH